MTKAELDKSIGELKKSIIAELMPMIKTLVDESRRMVNTTTEDWLMDILHKYSPEVYAHMNPNDDPNDYVDALKLEFAINYLKLPKYDSEFADLIFKIMYSIYWDRLGDNGASWYRKFGVYTLSGWVGDDLCRWYLIHQLVANGFLEHDGDIMLSRPTDLGKDYVRIFNYPDKK